MVLSCIVYEIYSELLVANHETFKSHLYLAPRRGVTPLEFRKDV